MPLFRFRLSAASLVLLACGSEPRAEQPRIPDVARAFSNLPLPPQPAVVSQAGGPEALQLTLHSPSDMDKVTEYYRRVLSTAPWSLVSDRKNSDGSVALYAEQKGPPLWVRIWKLGDRGTMVELTGAVVDSGKPTPSQPAAAPTRRK
jgi:hypothetical protein